MEYSPGDLLDRKGILELKINNGKLSPSQKEDAYKELREVTKALQAYTPGDVRDYFGAMIKKQNEDIWQLESDIRNGQEKKLSTTEIDKIPIEELKMLAVVGTRALRIRALNTKRIKFKNDTNRRFRTGFQEHKTLHASEVQK